MEMNLYIQNAHINATEKPLHSLLLQGKRIFATIPAQGSLVSVFQIEKMLSSVTSNAKKFQEQRCQTTAMNQQSCPDQLASTARSFVRWVFIMKSDAQNAPDGSNDSMIPCAVKIVSNTWPKLCRAQIKTGLSSFQSSFRLLVSKVKKTRLVFHVFSIEICLVSLRAVKSVLFHQSLRLLRHYLDRFLIEILLSKAVIRRNLVQFLFVWAC